jgi:FAD/FMN-containing dehydrogenase
VNALEDALEEGAHRVEHAYGKNYARLTTLKKTLDPTNFFSQNQNIGRSG